MTAMIEFFAIFVGGIALFVFTLLGLDAIGRRHQHKAGKS